MSCGLIRTPLTPARWRALATDKQVSYVGSRGHQGAAVSRWEGHIPLPLPPRLDLANHSPTGLEWGYMGSGPAQLALALLADVLYVDSALALYQRYKEEVVSKLPYEAWELGQEEVVGWAADHLALAASDSS